MKLSILLLIAIQSCFALAQTLVIDVPLNRFQVDHGQGLIISHLDDISTYGDLSSFSEVILTLDQINFAFEHKPNSLSFAESYRISNSRGEFDLYFTELPLISISTVADILDDPKVHGNFVYADSMQRLQADIGIELRGGFSQTYPKKTYDLEFWSNVATQEKRNVRFGDLRSDDDWVLDALYNEPLRLRSHIASQLWLDLHTPYYIDSKPEAKAGAGTKYVEVFINGSYNGIYDLSEQVDKKQLQLADYDGSVRGELHKGVTWESAVTFNGAPSFDNSSRSWSGYETKYPKEAEITHWNNLYEFTNFIVNSSYNHFLDSIWHKFNIENNQDYFIFLNLLRATDNTGKNIYIGKHDKNEPFFYTPWDLDGCFGTIWDGTNVNVSDDILTNGMFHRIIALNPNEYALTISDRWFSYRDSLLSNTKLTSKFETSYNYFEQNLIYERERLVYPNYSFQRGDLDYLNDWLERRLSFLDTYFRSLATPVTTSTPANSILLYPNPTTSKLFIEDFEGFLGQPYRIYSSLGAKVESGVVSNSFINTCNLTSGQYVLILDGKAISFVITQ